MTTTLSPTDAKPCPWCKQQPTIREAQGEDRLSYFIGCANVYCPVNPQVSGSTKAKALEHWTLGDPYRCRE